MGYPPFLETLDSTRVPWGESLKGERPKVDEEGYLDGEWGRAIVAAARYEFLHPDWNEMRQYEDNGPGGYVMEYMQQLGFDEERFMRAAAQLEDRTRDQLREQGAMDGLPDGHDDPRVWQTPVCEPKGYKAMVREAMDDTTWCFVNPCCCGGWGCSSPGDPMCLASSKTCCAESAVYTDDCCGDFGCCFSVEKCCCLVSHCSPWPGGGPQDGVPICACCNIRCGGDSDGDPTNNPNAQILREAFFCYYCCCFGTGVSMAFPLIYLDQKCCCLHTLASTASPCAQDRGMCYNYQKMCCLINACSFPCGTMVHDGIPTCACCGMACGKDASADSGSESN